MSPLSPVCRKGYHISADTDASGEHIPFGLSPRGGASGPAAVGEECVLLGRCLREGVSTPADTGECVPIGLSLWEGVCTSDGRLEERVIHFSGKGYD